MYNGFEGGMFCPYGFQGLALNLLVSQGAPPVEVSWPFQMSWQKLSSVPQNASIPRQDMRI